MGAPPPTNKTAKMGSSTKMAKSTTDKTGAIQASRDRTKAQTAPGTDYKAKKAAQKGKGGGYVAAKSGESAEEKRKTRLAKMREITTKARELRKSRSSMITGL